MITSMSGNKCYLFIFIIAGQKFYFSIAILDDLFLAAPVSQGSYTPVPI